MTRPRDVRQLGARLRAALAEGPSQRSLELQRARLVLAAERGELAEKSPRPESARASRSRAEVRPAAEIRLRPVLKRLS
jgi:hypothetical protein